MIDKRATAVLGIGYSKPIMARLGLWFFAPVADGWHKVLSFLLTITRKVIMNG